MKTMRFTNALVGTAVMLSVMSAVSVSGRAQNVQSKATVSVKPPTAQQPPGGIRDGLKVHGHWTIDVRNPNGTLASHREFENSLVGGTPDSGAGILAQLLTEPTILMNTTMPHGLDWAIQFNPLDGNPDHHTCLADTVQIDGTRLVDCLITKLADNIVNGINTNGPNSGPVHTLVPSRSGASALDYAYDKVRLDGYITAGYDGSITRVLTRLGGTANPFSHADLGTPIAVLANQVITVTVLFTFS
jgi:hypothetical protein